MNAAAASPTPAPTPAPAQVPSAPRGQTGAQPTIHERALVTWATIFPLVIAGQWALGPFVHTWPPVLQVLAMTIVVVPVATYLVMPRVMALYLRLTRR